jgi:hypothetical protein
MPKRIFKPSYYDKIMTAFDEVGIREELQHTISYDSKGKLLEGNKKYTLHLPSPIPASDFWSIIVYDQFNRLMIHTDQPWPSIYSNNKNLIFNNDGSVDAWFGPDELKGKESNWVKTIPGQKWYMILRLYYPLQDWFDNKWRPGEIIEII